MEIIKKGKTYRVLQICQLVKNNKNQEKEKNLKEENHTYSNKKEGEMTKKSKPKDKTIMGVIGVLLTLFGIIGTLPVLQNRQYIWLTITAIAVIIGVILVAYSLD